MEFTRQASRAVLGTSTSTTPRRKRREDGGANALTPTFIIQDDNKNAATTKKTSISEEERADGSSNDRTPPVAAPREEDAPSSVNMVVRSPSTLSHCQQQQPLKAVASKSSILVGIRRVDLKPKGHLVSTVMEQQQQRRQGGGGDSHRGVSPASQFSTQYSDPYARGQSTSSSQAFTSTINGHNNNNLRNSSVSPFQRLTSRQDSTSSILVTGRLALDATLVVDSQQHQQQHSAAIPFSPSPYPPTTTTNDDMMEDTLYRDHLVDSEHHHHLHSPNQITTTPTQEDEVDAAVENATGTAALAFRGYLGKAQLSLLCFLCADMVDCHEFESHLRRCQRQFDLTVRTLYLHPLCGQIRYPTLPTVEVDENKTTQKSPEGSSRKSLTTYTSPPTSKSSHAHRVAFNKASAKLYASLSMLCKGCGHHYPFGDMQGHLERCDRVQQTVYSRGDSIVSVSVRYPMANPASYTRAVSEHVNVVNGITDAVQASSSSASRSVQSQRPSSRVLALSTQSGGHNAELGHQRAAAIHHGASQSAGSYLTTRITSSPTRQLRAVSPPTHSYPLSIPPSRNAAHARGGRDDVDDDRSHRVPFSSRTTSPQRCRVLVRATSPVSRQQQRKSSGSASSTIPPSPHSDKMGGVSTTASGMGTAIRTLSWTRARITAENEEGRGGAGTTATTTTTISPSKLFEGCDALGDSQVRDPAGISIRTMSYTSCLSETIGSPNAVRPIYGKQLAATAFPTIPSQQRRHNNNGGSSTPLQGGGRRNVSSPTRSVSPTSRRVWR